MSPDDDPGLAKPVKRADDDDDGDFSSSSLGGTTSNAGAVQRDIDEQYPAEGTEQFALKYRKLGRQAYDEAGEFMFVKALFQ